MKKLLLVTMFSILFSPLIVFAAPTDEIDSLNSQMNNVAEQTSTTLNKARQLIRVATTTAGVAVDAYNKTEQAVSSTVEVVKRGSAVYENLKKIADKIGDVWNWLTNNSEPWRVAVVVTGIIGVWVLLRFVI
ncbi:MAG: hypothetical protein WC725_02945 [Patescibacteria group bacterium]|jgi:hypothetical protein